MIFARAWGFIFGEIIGGEYDHFLNEPIGIMPCLSWDRIGLKFEVGPAGIKLLLFRAYCLASRMHKLVPGVAFHTYGGWPRFRE
jgi:hypothetical protein